MPNRVNLVLWICAIVLLAGAILIIVWPGWQEIAWVGRFDVVVHVDASPDIEVDSIRYATFYNEAAMHEAKITDLKLKRRMMDIENYDGRTFTADVKSWGRQTVDGRDVTYQQNRLIVVRFRLKDGSTIAKQAKIPDGRENREITVSIP